MLNFTFALGLYSLVWILYRFSNQAVEAGFIRRVARFLYRSYYRSVFVLLTLWVYVLVSLAFWIELSESYLMVMLLGIGLVGGAATIIELKTLTLSIPLSDGRDFYISTIEYYFKTKSEEGLKDAILGIIIESETDIDAKQALDLLLLRDDLLGKTTRKIHKESLKE